MNSHKNARTTFAGRKLLMERIGTMGLMAAVQVAGISVPTVRKWLRRFEVEGEAGLQDRSSRPNRTRPSIDVELGARIQQLCRERMPMRRIAQVVGRSVAAVCLVGALRPESYSKV